MNLVTRKDFSFSLASEVTWETINRDSRKSDPRDPPPVHPQMSLPQNTLDELTGHKPVIRRPLTHTTTVARDIKFLNKYVHSSPDQATTSGRHQTTIPVSRVTANAPLNIHHGLADHFNEYHAFAGGFLLVISLAITTVYIGTTTSLYNFGMPTSLANVSTATIVNQDKRAGLVIRDPRQARSIADSRSIAEKHVRAMAQIEFEHRLARYRIRHDNRLRNTRVSHAEVSKLASSGVAINVVTQTTAMH